MESDCPGSKKEGPIQWLSNRLLWSQHIMFNSDEKLQQLVDEKRPRSKKSSHADTKPQKFVNKLRNQSNLHMSTDRLTNYRACLCIFGDSLVPESALYCHLGVSFHINQMDNSIFFFKVHSFIYFQIIYVSWAMIVYYGIGIWAVKLFRL
jgi:hypothetical protein